MNLTCDEKKAAVITTPLSNLAKFLGISTIFQFQPTPKSNKNQSFTHSAELELYIDEALKKAF